MISEIEWKFFEATEQRIKHLERHRAENRSAILCGDPMAMDPEELIAKQAAIAQEMEYPARVEAALASNPTPEQERQLHRHRRWILGTLFETHPEIAPLLESLRVRFATFIPHLRDRETTWSEIRRILREDEDRELRADAWKATSPLAGAVEQDLHNLFRLREALARAVVSSGFPQVAYHVIEQERRDVIPMLDEFERTTRTVFEESKFKVADALGVRMLEPWDYAFGVGRFGRLPENAFPADTALDAAEIQARRWGFEPRDLPIRVEYKEMVLSGWTAAIEVPGDVRILFPGGSGAEALGRLFYHYGEALYFCHLQSRRHFLDTESPIIPEAIGRLFESVTLDPEWLVEQTGAARETIKAHLEALKFERLFRLRFAHASSSFENVVYAHGDSDPHRLYCDIVEQVLGWTKRPDIHWAHLGYLADRPMQKGTGILAAHLAAQMQECLENRDKEWRYSVETGTWLKDNMFATGGAATWETKVERSTGKPLAIDAIRREFGAEPFRGPGLEAPTPELSDAAVDDYFKDIDLSDIDTD